MAGTDRARVRALVGRLDELSWLDAHRLGRRLERHRRGLTPDQLEQLVADIDSAAARLAARRAAVPPVRYPDQLPVSARREEIAAAIRDHQVVVVAGETGSGKTTQLPKICLELGRGVRGLIGHTQPRRLAARTVADRIAEELDTPLGELIGYVIRFSDHVSEASLVKVMTDGILLAELQRDRRLLAYDTLIVDEAHERSLNIDFILGYLHRLLPTRPELKVIITSATIETDRFARHFAAADGTPAPVIEVSGRTYPVQVRYRPLVAEQGPDSPNRDEPRDQASAVCDAVDELAAEGHGDVLVFLSGEREIRDTADALRERGWGAGPTAAGSAASAVGGANLGSEVLPLYARLSNADQHRVFAPHPGRRIVLATNVAETSLTVPGIRYVVDAGTARISRYSMRRKVQRLPIEAISQASANQRAGRCGRVAEGICIRLYAQEDFEARPPFTDPEILRTNLASVILQMAAIGLGEVADFPFLDPPEARSIADGITLLTELGALDPHAEDPRGRLTDLGRRLAALPVDPRIGRMIIEADRYGALREVIVIAAALSIQDPREWPSEATEAARAQHARFVEPGSDFLTYLNLWRYLRERQRELSSSRFRKLCRQEFLHYLRVREWQDLVAQLRQAAGDIGLRWNSADADPHKVHLALLAGLITHVGMRDPERGDFLGPRNTRFAIFPGSGLARRPPSWVMAAELVETSRLFARTVAKVEPGWVEPLAEHLVKRTYSEPHWSSERGAVLARERVTLYGLPLVAGRTVDYARIDPAACRELFLRHALVEGDWRTHHAFFAHNQHLRAEVEELEERSRRRDLLVDDEQLFAFYDARVPADVVSARHFDSWWKKTRRTQPRLLDLDPATLRSAAAGHVRDEDYPSTWPADGQVLELTYQFEPGADADGVTVHIPLPLLNRIRPDGFDWQVPGLRADLVAALIRSLPKAIRRSFVPAGDHAAAVLARLDRHGGSSLTEALGDELEARAGVRIDPDDWDLSRVPAHLRMTFRVHDEDGRVLGEGKDLTALARELAPDVHAMVAAGAADLERDSLAGWPDLPEGRLPRTHERVHDGRVVIGFPTLVDEGGRAALRVFADKDAAQAAMWAGTRRLLATETDVPTKQVLARLPNRAKLALAAAPHPTGSALFADCADAAIDALMREHGGPSREAGAHQQLLAVVRAGLPDRFAAVVDDVVAVLTAAQEADAAIATAPGGAAAAAVADMRAQYEALLYPGFVAATGTERLGHLVRYLRGIVRRLDKLAAAPDRDAAAMAQVTQLTREYAELRDALPATRRADPDVLAIRWMLEELRISLFAQSLGTAHPVSEKRILKAMDAAEAVSPTAS